MGRSISPMEKEPVAGSDPRAAPRLIVPMSLQLIIPRRVALQQSSPPLHQPSVILKEKRNFEKEKPSNCMCANFKLSQPRGSPHESVPFCAYEKTTNLGKWSCGTAERRGSSGSALPSFLCLRKAVSKLIRLGAPTGFEPMSPP